MIIYMFVIVYTIGVVGSVGSLEDCSAVGSWLNLSTFCLSFWIYFDASIMIDVSFSCHQNTCAPTHISSKYDISKSRIINLAEKRIFNFNGLYISRL